MRWNWLRRTDVLVGGVILVTVIGLLIPSIMPIRDAVNRTRTNNKLRACAAAIQAYEKEHRRLPDAFGNLSAEQPERRSMWFVLLPHLKEEDAYRPERSRRSDRRLSRRFRSVARRRRQPNQLPELLEARSGLSAARIPAGSSNTLMLTTRYANCSGVETRYGDPPSASGGFFGLGAHRQPASSEAGIDDLAFQIQPDPLTSCNPTRAIYGHSLSTGGLSIAMGDGCVRNLSPAIRPKTIARILCPASIRGTSDWNDE